jgi:hypothetical protein
MGRPAELLERRDVPASVVTATLAGAELRVEGTDQADSIYLFQDAGRISVADRYSNNLVSINGATSVAAASLSRIVVEARGGDDMVSLNNSGHGKVSVPSVVRGGFGRDTIYGGSGNDLLDGGVGVNLLYGNGGFDSFRQASFSAVVNGCAPTDVEQKSSPTCQTLAALAECAKQGQNFGSLISRAGSTWTVTLPGAGKQTIFFDGTWTSNDPVPQPNGSVYEVWPLLMQRARLASLGVSYSGAKTEADWDADQSRTGGRLYDPAHALQTFTARPTSTKDIAGTTPAKMKLALAVGSAVVFSSIPGGGKKDLTADGIVCNHAYAVLRVYQQGSQWFVDLYNPWKSDAGNKTKVGPAGSPGATADDGIVTLTWTAVSRSFDSASIARKA